MDLGSKTNDQLLDRLAELGTEVEKTPLAGDRIDASFRGLYGAMQEVALIHIELAKRTASGWRPL